jgi:DNA mismatch repair protein MutL
MPIERLSPRVAEQIAAGEVIERPAAVVKELLENALDAGSTEICVRLEDGGKALIEVTDNGHGIEAGELPLALARHATSKLRSIEDLENLGTLGFRGEALASIGAVSRLEVLSRAREAASGDAHSVSLDHSTQELCSPQPRATTFGHFLGAAHGTRIRAEGLFSQIPARLKFLKSAGAELSAVREWIERLSLAHPGVGFKLISDEKEVLVLRPQTQEERVRTIVAEGQDFPIRMAEADSGPGFRLKVYWIQGMSLSHTRNLVQLVNGRALRDRLIQQAMLGPFRQALLPGRFPAACAFIEVDPREIDVNVHPTKTEIRFLESRKLFTTFDAALGSLIRTHGSISFVGSEPMQHPGSGSAAQGPMFGFQERGPGFMEARVAPESDIPLGAPAQGPALHPALAGFAPSRFLGVLFRTYLAYDLGEELGLIDQHAAHERIRFEALKARALRRAASNDSQALLIPEVVRFDPPVQAELQARLPLLTQLGFEAEIFGPGQLLFRAAPPEWGSQDLRMRLSGLTDRLLSLPASELKAGESLLLDERLFEKLASEACRSSVRAGDRVEAWGAQALVEQLSRCEHPWNCPHGRPTVARVPRARFEDWFSRTV